MSGSASNISVTISAIDQTAKTIDAITARMNAFGKRTQASVERVTAPVRSLQNAVKAFGDVSGLTRVGAAFGGIARSANDAYGKVGQVIPLIGIVGSAASVAGITRMVTAWAELGSKVSFASQRIGIAASGLSNLQGAATLAGSSAGDLTGGMQALGQSMFDAIGGRSPEAIVMFRTLGIAFQDASGHARKVADVLPEIADKIHTMKDPYAQAAAATALFGGAAEGLLPLLRLGSAGIRRYTDDARRYNPMTDSMAAAAVRLQQAQNRVSLAVTGFSNRIAERLEPVLTPLLTHLAEWIATSPQVAQGVEWLGQKVGELGKWIDGGGVQQFGDTLKTWIEPLGHIAKWLGGDGGVVGAIELLMGLMATRFAIQVITPFINLGTAILGVTTNILAMPAAIRILGASLDAFNASAMRLPVFKMLALTMTMMDKFGQPIDPATLPAGSPLLIGPQPDQPSWWQQHAPTWLGGKPAAGAPGSQVYNGPDASQGTGNQRNIRNNNPSNLMFAGQPGAVTDGRFARFANMQTGVAADLNQFLLYQDRDHLSTIQQMINRATPASENPGVGAYIARVAAAMGMSPGDSPNLHDPTVAQRWIMAIAAQEGGTPDANAVRAGVGMRLGTLLPPQPGGPALPIPAPSPSGAPMSLDRSDASDSGSKSTVRLEFGGKLPQGLTMRMNNPQNVETAGPLVERPMLLGAMP